MNLKDTLDFHTYMDMTNAIDIRIGKVTHAERVPKSNKMLQLTVSFGNEITKTVCTNLGDKYTPESFVDRKMPFVVNLPPANIMGVTSEAMIIVGTNDNGEIELDNYSVGSKLL